MCLRLGPFGPHLTTNGRTEDLDHLNNQILFSDVEAPILSCPNNQSRTMTFGKSTAVVFWDKPDASDNSGERPNISCSIDNGSQFAIGQTEVICHAQDNFGNRAECTFTVEIKGKLDG